MASEKPNYALYRFFKYKPIIPVEEWATPPESDERIDRDPTWQELLDSVKRVREEQKRLMAKP